MTRYYFDIHDDIDIEDQEGIELPTLRAAQAEALRAIAEIAAEILPGNGVEKDMSIAVRTRTGAAFTVTAFFKVQPPA